MASMIPLGMRRRLMRAGVGGVALALVAWLTWCGCAASGSATIRIIGPGEQQRVEQTASAETHDKPS